MINFKRFFEKVDTKYYVVSNDIYERCCNNLNDSVGELDKMTSYNSWEEAEDTAIRKIFMDNNSDSAMFNIIEIKKTVRNNSLLYFLCIIFIFLVTIIYMCCF